MNDLHAYLIANGYNVTHTQGNDYLILNCTSAETLSLLHGLNFQSTFTMYQAVLVGTCKYRIELEPE